MENQHCDELNWDLLTKKVDVIENQLRTIEKDHEKVVNILKGEVDLKEKANEFQREVSRQQKQLKQDILNLTGRFELLQNNENTLKTLSAHLPHVHPFAENQFGTSQKDIEDLVQQRVQQEVSRAMELALQVLAKEHQANFNVPHHNNTYASFKKEHHNVEEVSKLKNDQFKLMGEIERLKSRQVYFENICKDENRSWSVAAKSIETTELCKKGLETLRKECDDLFQALSNSFSELNVSLLTNKSQTSQLQSVVSALDAHAKHTEQVLSQFDNKLGVIHKYKKDSTEVLNKVHEQSEYLYAKVIIIENNLETNKSTILNEVDKKFMQYEASSRQDLETSLHEITDDFNKSMSDMTDAFNAQHATTLETVQQMQSNLTNNLTEKIDTVASRHTEIDERLKELNLNMSNISQTRAAIDSVLTEIDHRSQSDAAWSYNFNSRLQKYDIRLSSIEETMSLCQKNEENIENLRSVSEDHAKLIADLAVKSDTIVQDLNTTMLNFKEDIHTSLVNSDNQNVEQFNSIDDMIVKFVNDIPILIERAQTDTIDMCTDKQTHLQDNFVKMVEKSNHDLYDTLLVAIETPLKEQEDRLSESIQVSAAAVNKRTDELLSTLEDKLTTLFQQRSSSSSSPQRETEARLAKLMQSCLEEAKESYEAQLNPLLDIEDRFTSMLDENLEQMRNDCTAAINVIVAQLRESENLNNSRIEEVIHSVNSSVKDMEQHSASVSRSRVSHSSHSSSSYPSIEESSSSSAGDDHGEQYYHQSNAARVSPSSINSAKKLHNVSQFVYQSPKRPTAAAAATTSNNVFDNMRELGAPTAELSPSKSRSNDSNSNNKNNSSRQDKDSPKKEFILANESVFDVSNFVVSSNSESLSHIHTTSSMFDSSIYSSSQSGPPSQQQPHHQQQQVNSQLPPKIMTNLSKPPVVKSNLVYLTSSHYAISDMSPEFSVSSLMTTEDLPTGVVAPSSSSVGVANDDRRGIGEEFRVSNNNNVSSNRSVGQTSISVDPRRVLAPSLSPATVASEDSVAAPGLTHESFSDFNNIIDAVNTNIRALDLHLLDIHEGNTTDVKVATPPTQAHVAQVTQSISPIKVLKQNHVNNVDDDDDESDATSDTDDVLRATFLDHNNNHHYSLSPNNKDDLDLTSVDNTQHLENERRKAAFSLYEKKLNHRRSFRKSLRID